MLFCFFKPSAADEMRISDWSSDVCSSDLPRLFPALSSQALRFFHRPAIRHGGMVGLAGGRLARDSAGHRHGLHDRRPPPPGTPPVAGRYVFPDLWRWPERFEPSGASADA